MAPFDPKRHHRHSIRLKDYDYAQAGAYFVTLCTHNRKDLFGKIVEGVVHLSDLGCIVAEEWSRSSQVRQEIELDEWVVMPNHLHGIVVIIEDQLGRPARLWGRPAGRPHPGGRPHGPAQRSLGAFVAGFKSSATKRINTLRNMPGVPVWQRNYYEHIIRNERELRAIRQYIHDNPLKWELDRDNPANW